MAGHDQADGGLQKETFQKQKYHGKGYVDQEKRDNNRWATCRVENKTGDGFPSYGSGVLIDGSSLGFPDACLLTNKHVIRNRDEAASCTVLFHYENSATKPVEAKLNPAHFKAHEDEDARQGLDFCVVAFKTDVSMINAVRLNPDAAIKEGSPIDIWQHPEGGYKRLSQRNVLSVTKNTLTYRNRTDPGSSGAPIYNRTTGDLIGIHYAGDDNQNYGCRLSAIMSWLKNKPGAAATGGTSSGAAAAVAPVPKDPAPLSPDLEVLVESGNLTRAQARAMMSAAPDLEALVSSGDLTRDQARAMMSTAPSATHQHTVSAAPAARTAPVTRPSGNLTREQSLSAAPDLKALVASGDLTRDQARTMMPTAAVSAAPAARTATTSPCYVGDVSASLESPRTRNKLSDARRADALFRQKSFERKADAALDSYSPSLDKEVLVPTPEARERYALRMLYERCNGVNWPWGERKNWCDPDKPLSEWAGVEVEDGHVVGLSVSRCYDAFKGDFPGELEWLTQLEELNLRDNHIGAASAKALRPELEKLTNLTVLDLSANNLGAAGMQALRPALAKLRNITHLGLHNNNLGAAGAKSLRPALGKLTKLEYLNLHSNRLGADGVEALRAALEGLTNLTELWLQGNNLGVAGAKALRPALEKLAKLESLYLRNNNVGAAGAEALRPALEKMTNLAILDLNDNNLGAAGAAALRPALEKLTKLKMLGLSGNNVGADGAAALLPALEKLTKLEYLYLHSNNLGAAGVQSLRPTLENLKNLTHVDLNDTNTRH